MLEDYCNRLQQLNKEKNDFLKLKYKTNAKTLIDKKENKYHKYILNQIAYKNKLDAIFTITQLTAQTIIQQKRTAFDVLTNKNYLRDSQAYKSISKSKCKDLTQTHSILNSQKQITSSNQSLKQKLKQTACKMITKWAKNYNNSQVRSGFKSIKRKTNQTKQIQNIWNLIRRKIEFQKNVFIQQLKNLKPKEQKKIDNENKQNRSFIFSLNEFSQIIPYTIEEESQELSTSRIKNIEQIDSKFAPLSQSNILAPQKVTNDQNQCKLMLQSFEKLKDQVLLMKNLLNQKNKLLKLKDEQIYKIKKDYENKIETLHDEISSKIQIEFQLRQSSHFKSSKINHNNIEHINESQMKQLQTHIIGDLSPRGNQVDQDPVSHQLLQKYMKQSFQMREKMDMARQMCEQFEFDSRTDEGQIMMEIIKLLTPEERLNAYVD